jgi:hypothetical protein
MLPESFKVKRGRQPGAHSDSKWNISGGFRPAIRSKADIER